MIVNKVFSRKNSLLCVSAIVLLSTLSQPAFAEKVLYVSDQLSVPVRSGASNGHRIIKFLSSGVALTVLESSEYGKFVHVKLSGDKTGWVLADNLMDTPSARAQLAAVNQKLEKSRQQTKPLYNTIAELKSEIKDLKNENKTLQNERTNLSNSLDDIKITAANPLALSKKNKALKKDLDKAEANLAMLQDDNKRLSSNMTQEWFLIGGGVSMGSLIIGLILTRINWRRKRDSWGDSF